MGLLFSRVRSVDNPLNPMKISRHLWIVILPACLATVRGSDVKVVNVASRLTVRTEVQVPVRLQNDRAYTWLPGHRVPALSGQVVKGVLPNQIVKPLPGQLVPLLAGQLVPPLNGQVVQSLPGQMVKSLSGEIVVEP